MLALSTSRFSLQGTLCAGHRNRKLKQLDAVAAVVSAALGGLPLAAAAVIPAIAGIPATIPFATVGAITTALAGATSIAGATAFATTAAAAYAAGGHLLGAGRPFQFCILAWQPEH